MFSRKQGRRTSTYFFVVIGFSPALASSPIGEGEKTRSTLVGSYLELEKWFRQKAGFWVCTRMWCVRLAMDTGGAGNHLALVWRKSHWNQRKANLLQQRHCGSDASSDVLNTNVRHVFLFMYLSLARDRKPRHPKKSPRKPFSCRPMRPVAGEALKRPLWKETGAAAFDRAREKWLCPLFVGG